MDNTSPPVFDSFSIKTVLADAKAQLDEISDSATLDAELLLGYCLGKTRTYLHTWPEKELNIKQYQDFKSLIKKRATDYPVAYLLGQKSFWTLDLIVTPDVLIPRPETELLIEVSLEKIASIANPKILDLGTGSGAIALALASERKDAMVMATDYSEAALKVAKLNVDKNQLSNNIELLKSDWFSEIKNTKFDLIISNPPYISSKDPHLDNNIRFEPRSALVAKDQGMHDIETIINNSISFLKSGGWLMIEHGYEQATQTQKLFSEFGYSKVDTISDYNNQPRLTLGQRA